MAGFFRSISSGRGSGARAVNLLFYKNEIPSEPDGAFIEDIHAQWKGNYHLLEVHHGYIQWLFPVFESSGMNFHSESLTKDEAKQIRRDLQMSKRVVQSYRLMLDFYGLELVDARTGAVRRAAHWQGRYAHLNRSSHNYLRINRILTSLGHLGYTRYKQPLLSHFEREVLENGELANCKRSLMQFWRATLDVDSAAFKRKTLETADDREDSAYLQYLDAEYEKQQAATREGTVSPVAAAAGAAAGAVAPDRSSV